MVLIVYAHPNPRSFNAAILETCREEFARKGYETALRDLYALGFDPVLKASDLAGIQAGEIPADIRVEQEYVAAADLVTFIHPIWWTGMPAIFKGYIDRVLCYGFAYRFDAQGVIPLLRGKKALIFNTQGTPGEVYERAGMFEALKKTSDVGIYRFCGFEIVDHVFFPAVPTVDDETRRGYLGKVREIIASL